MQLYIYLRQGLSEMFCWPSQVMPPGYSLLAVRHVTSEHGRLTNYLLNFGTVDVLRVNMCTAHVLLTPGLHHALLPHEWPPHE